MISMIYSFNLLLSIYIQFQDLIFPPFHDLITLMLHYIQIITKLYKIHAN